MKRAYIRRVPLLIRFLKEPVRDIERSGTLYAALLTRPDRGSPVDEGLFAGLKLRFPGYEPVYEEEGGLRILRLRSPDP